MFVFFWGPEGNMEAALMLWSGQTTCCLTQSFTWIDDFGGAVYDVTCLPWVLLMLILIQNWKNVSVFSVYIKVFRTKMKLIVNIEIVFLDGFVKVHSWKYIVWISFVHMLWINFINKEKEKC